MTAAPKRNHHADDAAISAGPSGNPALRDVAGFVDAYEQNYRRVAAYVYRRISDQDLTEELTAETFLRAYRNREQFRGTIAVVSWLLGIAAHVVYRHTRRRRLEGQLLRMIGRSRAMHVNPDRTADACDELRRVREAIDALPSIQQKVVSLHCLEGVPLKDIAAALGIAEGTAKSRLSRARQRLRDELGELPDWSA